MDIDLITNVTKKEKTRNPANPFTTSDITNNRWHCKSNFKARKTMMVAQQLYEGIYLKTRYYWFNNRTPEPIILIPDTAESLRKYRTHKRMANLTPKNVKHQGKQGDQDAHEAIRPQARCVCQMI